MAKIHELKAQLGKAVDELEAMASKSEADGFKEDVYEALKVEIAEIKKRIVRAEEAANEARHLSQPVEGQDRSIPSAPASAHKLYSGRIKFFQDREIDGRTVRAIDQAYAAGMWAKATLFGNEEAADWCKSRGIGVTKAQSEGVDSAGGFLVPEEMANAIITLREQYGTFRKECRVVPMGSDTMNWPRRTSGLTAYFVGENQSLNQSQLGWDNVNLTAKKAATLTLLSSEIDQDAVFALADILVEENALALATKEDDCGFNGDGTSAYGGIRGLSQVFQDGAHTAGQFQVSSATLGSLVAKDFTSVMGLLPQYAIGGAKWYMSQQMFLSAAGAVLAGAGGNKIADLQEGFRLAMTAGAGTNTDILNPMLLGFPVSIQQKAPISTPGSGKPMFYFGNLAKASLMGERRGITIARSDHRYFDSDQIGLRATERFDINNHDLGDNTNAGPLVAAKSP